MSKQSRANPQPSRGSTARAATRWPRIVTGLLGLAGVVLTAGLLYVAAGDASLPYCASGSDCDVVQGSRFSRFIGLPVTVWGLLVYAAIAVAALMHMRARAIIFFATVGFGVSVYLNVASYYALRAWCPYCLVSLVLITALYALSWYACHGPALKQWRIGSTLAALLVAGAMGLYHAGVFDPAAGPEDPYLRELAEHLTASGAKFYGASWCPHCQQQKDVFTASAKRLPYVECAPNGPRGGRSTECLAADIRNYPTWSINGRRYERQMTPKQLARYAGFRPPPTSTTAQ